MPCYDRVAPARCIKGRSNIKEAANDAYFHDSSIGIHEHSREPNNSMRLMKNYINDFLVHLGAIAHKVS